MKSRRNLCYIGIFLGGISLGFIALSIGNKVQSACDRPTSIAGQICQGKIPKQISEDTWAQIGAIAYEKAAQFMRSNNGVARRLDEDQKRYLRPHFGDLVDRVSIVYEAQLMDEWVAASFRINVGHSNAQVYGDRIYLKQPYKPDDLEQIILLAHELVHVRQYEQFGGLDRFGYHYFREYKLADESYRDNKMEQEAFEFEEEFARWLMRERWRSRYYWE